MTRLPWFVVPAGGAALVCMLMWSFLCSQPPLLSHMVSAIFEAERDRAWLHAAFPALEREYRYWTSAPKQLRVRAAWQGQGAVHQLARYYADTEEPRPEGYRSVQGVKAVLGH